MSKYCLIYNARLSFSIYRIYRIAQIESACLRGMVDVLGMSTFVYESLYIRNSCSGHIGMYFLFQVPILSLGGFCYEMPQV